MSKGVLIFKLPEEQQEFQVASRANVLAYIVTELQEFLRQKVKYADISVQDRDTYEIVRTQLNDLINDNDASELLL